MKIITSIMLVLFILGIIFTISYYVYYRIYQLDKVDAKIMTCIARRSTLYLSNNTDSAEQIMIIGKYLNLFNVTSCYKNNSYCLRNKVLSTPTWEINKLTYMGTKDIKELKLISGC